jgi:hypothetical protein
MPHPHIRTPARSLASLSGLALALSLLALLALPGGAAASKRQVSIIQDDGLMLADPVGTLATFRTLGATTVRVTLSWYHVTRNPGSSRRPAHFNGSDPNAYPASGWAPYDQMVRDATADGMHIDFTIAGGSPVWADGPGIPPGGTNPYYAWKPSARLFGQFVHAAGERYDGSFKPEGAAAPLPAVRFWTIWNEPNFGEDLGPQAIHGSTVSVAPALYRALVDTGWSALHQTGHGHDTILIGGFAARGLSLPATRRFPQGLPGNYAQTKPLQFIRTLYCVGADYVPLRGGYARARGCPTSAAGSRRFRSAHPGLFNASGVSDHPYQGSYSPVGGGNLDPDYALFPDLGKLERELDRVNRIYGSRTRYSIYNDEYGYITRPPAQAPYVSPAKAAYYLNWSEYLSWRSSRVASYMQYLLVDPPPQDVTGGGFASGLLTPSRKPKATLIAYRLPLYMPRTSLRRGRSAEVWGNARPALFAARDSKQLQTVAIQFKPIGGGGFETLKKVNIAGASTYFDVHVVFPRSGYVQLAYAYPQTAAYLSAGVSPRITSRLVRITVR